MSRIQRMQEHLLLIRRSVGWTAEKFGEEIGVTRQTINNLEKSRKSLTKSQYLAMRYVLNMEIAKSFNDTKMLQQLLEILVDNPDKCTKEEREHILAKANLMSPAILAGTSSRRAVSKEWIAATATITALVAFSLTAFQKKALLKDDEEEKLKQQINHLKGGKSNGE